MNGTKPLVYIMAKKMPSSQFSDYESDVALVGVQIQYNYT